MRISIPSCLKLDEKQIEVLQKWASQFTLNEEDIDCCGTGHTFEVAASGIGDCIEIRHGDKRLCLSYDDDGEIIGEV